MYCLPGNCSWVCIWNIERPRRVEPAACQKTGGQLKALGGYCPKAFGLDAGGSYDILDVRNGGEMPALRAHCSRACILTNWLR